MDGARIVVFEDRVTHRDNIRDVFEDTDHEVVAEGTTLDEALAVVDTMARGELAADVVILDGNLTPRTSNGGDARRIKEAMDANQLNVKVIGFSAIRGGMAAYGIPVDADSQKEVALLPELVDSL